MITAEEVNDAYGNLVRSIAEYHYACEEYIKAKTILDITKKMGLADGSIVGSNPDMREADARSKLSALYDDVEFARQRETSAKMGLDVARVMVNRAESLLRLMEIRL